MTTPVQRVPVRAVRGTKSELDGVVADLKEGEVCYATDQQVIYVVDGGALVATSIANPVYSNTTQALNGDDPILTPDQVANIVRMTSEGDYDAIATKDADCLYILPAPVLGAQAYVFSTYSADGTVPNQGDYGTDGLGFIFNYADDNGLDIRNDPNYPGSGNTIDIYKSEDGVNYTLVANAQMSDSGSELRFIAFGGSDGFDTTGPCYVSLLTEPAGGGGGGGNDLVAASGDAVNYIGEWTGDETSQSIVSASELSVVHIGSQNLLDFGTGGSLYFNLGADTANLPVGYNKNIEGSLGVASDSNVMAFTANGFTCGTSQRTNKTGDLNVAFGIRKDGEKALTNPAGVDSTVYLAAGEGIQVVNWTPTGSGSDNVLHGCGTTPDIIFWNGMNADSSSGANWYYNGAVFNTTTTYAADAQGAWRLDNLANTGADRQMTYDDSSFTTCSNTFSDFNGTSYLFTALCFYNVSGKSQTGRVSGPGGSALSINMGFRPKVVWWKPVDGSELWQQQMDNTSSTGVAWGGTGAGWNVATDITITATGIDIADGAVGNNGSGEGVYVAFR